MPAPYSEKTLEVGNLLIEAALAALTVTAQDIKGNSTFDKEHIYNMLGNSFEHCYDEAQKASQDPMVSTANICSKAMFVAAFKLLKNPNAAWDSQTLLRDQLAAALEVEIALLSKSRDNVLAKWSPSDGAAK